MNNMTPATVNVSNVTSLNVAFQKAIDELLLSYDSRMPSALPIPTGSGGWWIGANAWTAITLKDVRTRDQHNRKLMYSVLAHATAASSATFELNSFNDDQAWWALWACEAAHYDGAPYDPRWLSPAEGAWDRISSTWTDECGGGVVWDRSRAAGQGKKAIPNVLLMQLSSKLYELTRHLKYLQMAERTWAWLGVSGLIRGDGLLADATRCEQPRYNESCRGRMNWATYSYNTGVLIGALSNLYFTTRNATYLQAARVHAAAAIGSSAFHDARGVIHEGCNCGKSGTACCEDDGGDGVEFRGPFVRGLGALYEVDRDPAIRKIIQTTMRSALQRSCSDAWQFGTNWSGPAGRLTTLTQVPALDLLAASAAVLE